MNASAKLTVRVIGFKPLRSHSLFGFVDIVVDEMRLTIKEATVHESHGRRWIGLPAKPQLNKDGCVVVDERGKRQYANILQFDSRKVSDAFSERVIASLLERFPNAFDCEPERAP